MVQRVTVVAAAATAGRRVRDCQATAAVRMAAVVAVVTDEIGRRYEGGSWGSRLGRVERGHSGAGAAIRAAVAVVLQQCVLVRLLLVQLAGTVVIIVVVVDVVMKIAISGTGIVVVVGKVDTVASRTHGRHAVDGVSERVDAVHRRQLHWVWEAQSVA